LFTVVNRNEYDVDGDQMKVPATQGVRDFDFYHGEELKPDVRDAGHSLIRFPIEAKGYGAVLATNGELSVRLKAVLARMKPLTSTPLASFSHEWKILPVQIVPIKPTEPATSAPDDMVKIPPADFGFEVAGIENRRL
jgi:gamma-glutamyl hercynylcysteine S-oxide synthase